MLDEAQLRFPDSHFLHNVEGTRVHYTLTRPSGSDDSASSRAVHCLHGFGASTSSWDACKEQLADALGADVSCHDAPGFGLTGRYSCCC